jgi:hypothetical protein
VALGAQERRRAGARGVLERQRGHELEHRAHAAGAGGADTLFEGSVWGGDVGAGVWAGALRQSPKGQIHEVARARINGDLQWATLVSLAGLYGEGGIMTEAGEA